MVDESKLRIDESRGRRAKQLLEDELVNEAFKSLEDAYVLAWRSTAPLDEKAREKLYLAINVVGKVRDHLQRVVENGTLARKELDQLATDPRKKFLGVV